MKGSVLGRRFEYTLPCPPSRPDWQELITRMKEMSYWCAEQKFDHWGQEGRTFWFKFEKDYLLFMLRWS